MARKQSDEPEVPHVPDADMPDDSADWTSDDVPRISLGEGVSKKGEPLKKRVEGRYLYSIRQRIKRRMTTLHRFSGGKVDGERIGGEFLVYGSGAINSKIAKLPGGTMLRLTYQGEIDVGQDSPMKNIKVEWPRGTKLLDKAVQPGTDGDDDPGVGDDDAPF